MKKAMMTAGLVIFSVMFISQYSRAQEMQMKSSKSEISFPQKVYSGGMMEVKLGKLAQQNANSDKVKQFGERMIADHSKANEELKDIAKKNNIMLPDSMLDMHKSTYEELSKYKGKEFDEKYINKMVDDHEKVVKTFEDESQHAKNQEIRQWAKNTLPTLRQHLKLAQQTLKELKSNK